jgi:four helix bundle protein
MNAKSVEELVVYQKAIEASSDISTILERDAFTRHVRLREQMGASSERVVSSISEGFEMSTDKHFAQYCYRAKGSSREIRTQLVVAQQRHIVTEEERVRISNKYEEIAKMLTGLIAHLEREDRKRRR